MARGGVATAGREAASVRSAGIGLQEVAIDTLQLLCVVGVIETLGTVSWRMAPTSDTRKISGASGSDQESLVEALLEGMGEGFFAFDHSWRLTASNSAATGGAFKGVSNGVDFPSPPPGLIIPKGVGTAECSI